MKSLNILGILIILLIGFNLPADAGIFSKISNWFNTGWNDYGYPTHNDYYNRPHRRGFYNNGNFTGTTPPVRSNYYPQSNDFFCPNSVNRFNHLPNGSIPQMNIPTRMITDFRSDVGTSTGVQILD